MISPLHVNVNKGGKFGLDCQTQYPHWFFLEPNGNSIYSFKQISITNATLKHNGEYYCYGPYTDDSKYFIAKTTVKVYGMSSKSI